MASLSTKISRKSWYLGGTFMTIDSCEDWEGLGWMGWTEIGGTDAEANKELGTGKAETQGKAQVEVDRELGTGQLGAGRQMSPMCEISSNRNNSCTESMVMSIDSESKLGARVVN